VERTALLESDGPSPELLPLSRSVFACERVFSGQPLLAILPLFPRRFAQHFGSGLQGLALAGELSPAAGVVLLDRQSLNRSESW
jgi:hypothetical protein